MVKQVAREYRCISPNLIKYLAIVARLLYEFDKVIIRHMPREQNWDANELAQIASKYKVSDSTFLKFCQIKNIFSPVEEREVMFIDQLELSDWRKPIVDYLRNPDGSINRKIKNRAMNYVILGDTLCRRSFDGGLSTCLGKDDAYLALAEVHEGICGPQQTSNKMKWTLN